MSDPADTFDTYVIGGLDAMGLDADEVDLAVMAAAHNLWWPAIEELLSIDFDAVEPEQPLDLSRAPGKN